MTVDASTHPVLLRLRRWSVQRVRPPPRSRVAEATPTKGGKLGRPKRSIVHLPATRRKLRGQWHSGWRASPRGLLHGAKRLAVESDRSACLG